MIADLAFVLDLILWLILMGVGIALMCIGREERNPAIAVGSVAVLFVVILRATLVILPSLIHQQNFIYR